METMGLPGHPLPYDTYREAIDRETVRFADVVRGADPTTAVPSCPDWTLAELTKHAGAVQRWFCALLTRLPQEPPRSRDVDLGLPSSEEAYADWLAQGVSSVATVLRATDPDAPMWAWGPDHHARFWARRMLFETLVHRVDAERTVGRESAIDATLAADGVDEFLVNLPHAGFFAPGVAKLRGKGEVIAFRSTDTAEEWRVRLDPEGFGVERQAEGEPAPPHTTVRGGAADLLLLLYGRRRYQDGAFDVSGDVELLDHWLTHSAF